MLEQQGNTLRFIAFYTESKVGKTGLTVTLDLYEGTNEIVTGGSATEIGDGLYYYDLSSGSVDANALYIAVFKTATSTVDQQHIPALWVVGRSWVNRVDENVSAAKTLTAGAQNALIADLLDEVIAGGTVQTALEAIFNTTSLGAGALSFTYTLTRSDNGNPIDDAAVWVTTDSAGTNIIANGRTDASGEVTFDLDAGTYYFWRNKSGFNFTNPDTEVISA